MLYISLLILLPLLGLINLVLYCTGLIRTRPVRYLVIFASLVFAFGPILFVTAYMRPVIWQVGLIFVLLPLLIPHRGRRFFLPLSCVAAMAAYGLQVRSTQVLSENLTQLKNEYPYESLKERLPSRSIITSSPTNDPKRLDNLERDLAEVSNDYGSWQRSEALKRLHETSVKEFTSRPGFGFDRMDFVDRADAQAFKMVYDYVSNRPLVKQPDYLRPFISPVSGLKLNISDQNSFQLLKLHDDGVLDFINPRGFGFAKDRDHVAGFLRHGMSKVPVTSLEWSVAHLELVGLVVHEKPVVYQSAYLPQMEEVQTIPTRPLDFFENEGLEALRRGEDLYFRGTDKEGRMMGSIRAVKQCLVCHEVSRGDLLGAFTYGLIRNDKPELIKGIPFPK
jgi:hypothetical protein